LKSLPVGGGFICFGLRTFSIISSAFSLRICFIESGAFGFARLGETGIQVFLLLAILFTEYHTIFTPLSFNVANQPRRFLPSADFAWLGDFLN
jgi:hypothetical protein